MSAIATKETPFYENKWTQYNTLSQNEQKPWLIVKLATAPKKQKQVLFITI